jgi:hypothetical protein
MRTHIAHRHHGTDGRFRDGIIKYSLSFSAVRDSFPNIRGEGQALWVEHRSMRAE